MSRGLKIILLLITLGIAISLLTLPRLGDNATRPGQRAEERARREVTRPPISTPSDVTVKARIYWANAAGDALAPVDVQLPLSADPVERAKQLIETLITKAPSERQRTLPADATLLEFYLLPDGSAVADFSGALATTLPSGILSEQLAVESVVQTLRANVAAIVRLKILIAGQEVDALAGHVDLSDFFEIRPAAPSAGAAPAAQAAPPVL